ncbi:hypothetical protein OS493_015715 [Desmophyllum pertusum]|uniref:Uncharacterized protein n=1 Tax=Desmophyllum pertusum TaxID=174260 RepID=A0A9X0CL02_9CNID|nr:hypothetical protein OS493_015715 [Desmophyllum pertusum]
MEGQTKLEDTNTVLQQENAKLKNQLSRLEGTKKKVSKRAKSSRSESNVEIPNDLRKRFRFIYKKMVEKNVTQGFIIDEDPQSEGNQDIFTKIKEILKKEHGGENCKWTDLQMEAQFYRYFKTNKEREQRIRKGKNEEHKEKCKKTRRLLNKLERRQSSYDMLKNTMTPKEKQLFGEILYIDYMSSEESEFEDQEDFVTGEKEKKLVKYVTKQLSWERTSLTSAKARLDRTYRNNLTPHARAMAKPRSVGVRPRGVHLQVHFGL